MRNWVAFLTRSLAANVAQKSRAAEPRWNHGFGVYRESPWHLAGLYNERRSAERKLKKLQLKQDQTGYKIAWGKVQHGLDNFVVLDKDRGLKHPRN